MIDEQGFGVLFAALSAARNNTCWRISRGRSSSLSLEFGRKITRTPPKIGYNGETLTKGEYSLLVMSTWRLRKNSGIVLSTWCNQTESAQRFTVLENLVLRDFVITSPTLDLTLQFENEWYLDIFCDIVDNDAEHYFYSTFTELFTVSNGPLITVESISNKYID